jgi:hypothetical protein
MLLESAELSGDDAGSFAHASLTHLTSTEGGGLHDDIERLIDIAAQLFSAIEVHIHHLEDVLTSPNRDDVKSSSQTVFKERLIRTAASLNASLCEVALNLEGRAGARTFAPQD